MDYNSGTAKDNLGVQMEKEYQRGHISPLQLTGDGFTIRQRYACAALQGYLANPQFVGTRDPEHIALKAFEFADEMIKAENA